MAIHANITRRLALLGAAASTAALAIPVAPAAADVDLLHLSNETLSRVLVETFDQSTVDQQINCIRKLHDAGGRVAEIGDILQRRFDARWHWVPTHIPGLSVPSND